MVDVVKNPSKIADVIDEWFQRKQHEKAGAVILLLLLTRPSPQSIVYSCAAAIPSSVIFILEDEYSDLLSPLLGNDLILF